MRISAICALAVFVLGPPALAQKYAVRASPAHKAVPTPSAVQLPVFSFMGDDTETVTTRTKLNDADCTKTGDVLSCTDYSNPSLAGKTLSFLVLKYNKGKLFEVLGSMPTFASDDVLAAFKEKYGNPHLETRKWQSKAGATFDNLVATWQFKGGALEFDSMGSDINSSDFVFVSDANSPPKAPPKVDF